VREGYRTGEIPDRRRDAGNGVLRLVKVVLEDENLLGRFPTL
jgi:hypothetical protein